ncbi:MAG: right-handed parallel beta-helix repeat-containing protein, partial [Caulobacterales bacterium]
ILSSSGMTFQNLNMPVDNGATAVTVLDSTNVVLNDLKIHGTAATDVGLGVQIGTSSNVTVENSDITRTGSGIGFSQSDHINLSNNNIHDIETDGIIGSGSMHVLVQGNHFDTFHPLPGDHPDAIQFFGGPNGSGDDVTIDNNVIVRGSGEVYQGIFIENTNHVTIDGNAMAGTMFNGISVSAADTAVVSNNFVQGFTDMGSRIIVRGQSSNVTVTHNDAQSVVEYDDNGLPNPNYVATDNTVIGPANVSDLSALNTWLSQHAEAVVTPVSGVVNPVANPNVTPVAPNLPNTGPVDVNTQVANLTASLEQSIHEMINKQIASSSSYGWIIL